MKLIDIPEIKEAKRILNLAESKFPLLEFIDLYTIALEIINDYIDANRFSPNIKCIINVKVSYTRNFLKKISLLDGDLKEIQAIFKVFYKDEVPNIVYEDLISRNYYYEIVNKWRNTSENKLFRAKYLTK